MLRGVFLIHAWALDEEDVEHEAWDQPGLPHYMVYHASRRLLLALPQVLVLHDRDVQDPEAFVRTQLRVAPVGLQVHGTSECVLGCSMPAHCVHTHACCWAGIRAARLICGLRAAAVHAATWPNEPRASPI